MKDWLTSAAARAPSRNTTSRLLSAVIALAVSSTAASVILEPSARDYPAIAVLEVLVIVGYGTAGSLLANDPLQRSNGTLLICTALLQGATHLHLVEDSPLPMVAWICGPLSATPAAVVLLRFPGNVLDPIARGWAILHTTWLVGSRLTFVIPSPERRLGWWPALPMSEEVAPIASAVGNIVLVASTLFFTLLLLRRVRSCRGMARYEVVPVLVAAVSASFTVMLHLSSVLTSRQGVPVLVLGLEQFGLLMVPTAFVFSAIAMRMARAAVGNLLLQVNYSTRPDQLEAVLARTLSDPNLELYLWDSQAGGWADTEGHPLTPSPDRGRLAIKVPSDDGTPLAIIHTDSSISRNQHLLEATIAATRLTLENASALNELRRSRTRIAEAGIAERRRLERDLHDGAQQRLLALGISLDLVRQAALDERTREFATIAAAEVRETIRELRDLARGIHPAVLTQSGLSAAVESATERMPLMVRRNIPGRRWSPATESTAYFVICEALTNVAKHAQSDQASVEVLDGDGTLIIKVVDNGCGGADAAAGGGLVGITDRVAALGGTVEVASPAGGGTCLTARIPYV